MSRLIEPLKSILTATLSTKLNPKLKTNPNTISVATCFFCAAVAISILCTLGCEGPKAAPKAKKPLNLLGNLDPDNNQTNLPKKRIATLEKPFYNSLSMRLVPIKPGSFAMGSPMSEKGRQDDEAQHQVKLTRGFLIGSTEVTQKQWETLMETTPWKFKDQTPVGRNQPATWISWKDADAFCQRLSVREDAVYRLPTEAEWEYASRAGQTGQYGFSDSSNLSANSWFQDSVPSSQPQPVASKQPNAFGVFDMHGNAAEWCADWYGKYARSATTDPTGPTKGEYRINRGGDWDSPARFCRSAYRAGFPIDFKSGTIGFRVVREVQ